MDPNCNSRRSGASHLYSYCFHHQKEKMVLWKDAYDGPVWGNHIFTCLLRTTSTLEIWSKAISQMYSFFRSPAQKDIRCPSFSSELIWIFFSLCCRLCRQYNQIVTFSSSEPLFKFQPNFALKHYRVKEIHFFFECRVFWKGNNPEIAKNFNDISIDFSSRTSGLIFSYFDTKHYWIKENFIFVETFLKWI